jgi:ABC-type multidrug transport system fused ATPase/permease subunit
MKMCLVLVLLAVIGLTCSITAQYFAAKAAVGFSTGLRHALFEHIQKLSFSEMDTVGTSTLITRMTSDINQTQNGVNLVLRLFLRSPFIVFGAMIMAFTIDVKAALVFVVTIPLLSIVVFGIMLVSIPLYKKVQSALDKVLGITRENLAGDAQQTADSLNQAALDAVELQRELNRLQEHLKKVVVEDSVSDADRTVIQKIIETIESINGGATDIEKAISSINQIAMGFSGDSQTDTINTQVSGSMVADAINKSLSDMTQVLTTCSQAITNMQEMYTTSLVPQLDNVIDSMSQMLNNADGRRVKSAIEPKFFSNLAR